MYDIDHPGWRLFTDMAELLDVSARDLVRLARRKWKEMHRRPRGGTLRPSELETPLWLALAAAVRPRLGKRGARALLARELGVHPSRVTEYFIRRHAMPDAERTLLILVWLSRRHRLAPPLGQSALKAKVRNTEL